MGWFCLQSRWYEKYARSARAIQVLPAVTLVDDQWNRLDVVVDLTAQTSTFYHNGVLLGTLNYSVTGAAAGVGQVQLENFGRSDFPEDWILIDNISVVPEPSSLASLGVLALGLVGHLRRRKV